MTSSRETTPSKPGLHGRRPLPRGLILFGLLIVVVAGGLGAYYFLAPLEAPIPAEAGAAYAALPQGYTSEGFPRLGDPDAPIVIEDYSSYACPHCRDFHDTHFVDLLDEIEAGQVQFIFIPVTHIGPGADDAARGALCAGEQGQFWTMHDVLFHWQAEFITRTFDTRRIEKGAEALELDVDAFKACLDSDAVADVLGAARAAFDWHNLSGTPTIFVNGERLESYRTLENLPLPDEDE